MTPARKVLRMTNNDSQPISIDPQWTNTSEWTVDMSSMVLKPGEQRDATITFSPTAAQPYSMQVPLEINGLYTINIDMKGEGCPMRIEVANPAQRTINFGAVNRGQSTTRAVQIVNRGRCNATLSLTPSITMLQRYNIDVLPAAEVLLRPRESADYTFFFR